MCYDEELRVAGFYKLLLKPKPTAVEATLTKVLGNRGQTQARVFFLLAAPRNGAIIARTKLGPRIDLVKLGVVSFPWQRVCKSHHSPVGWIVRHQGAI